MTMNVQASTIQRERGLTLVEMLAVLAIIGVVSGATLLSLPPMHSSSVKAEAGHLAEAIRVRTH